MRWHSRDAVGVDGADGVDIVVVVGVHRGGCLEVGHAHHRAVVVRCFDRHICRR